MNQTCKVCGEPAAGFHFGAFTCEGCKSFFGRSYNNLSSISECKNNGKCIIDKKNRTTCKACRLRKCYTVGMSKGGSRYGRRSNWFKIHCLLQEQQQEAVDAANRGGVAHGVSGVPVNGFGDMAAAAAQHMQQQQQRNSMLMGGLLGYPGYLPTEMMPSIPPFAGQRHSADAAAVAASASLPFFSMMNSLPHSMGGSAPSAFQLPPHLLFSGYHHPGLAADAAFRAEMYKHRQSVDSAASGESQRYSPTTRSQYSAAASEESQRVSGSNADICIIATPAQSREMTPELCVSGDDEEEQNAAAIPLSHQAMSPESTTTTTTTSPGLTTKLDSKSGEVATPTPTSTSPNSHAILSPIAIRATPTTFSPVAPIVAPITPELTTALDQPSAASMLSVAIQALTPVSDKSASVSPSDPCDQVCPMDLSMKTSISILSHFDSDFSSEEQEEVHEPASDARRKFYHLSREQESDDACSTSTSTSSSSSTTNSDSQVEEVKRQKLADADEASTTPTSYGGFAQHSSANSMRLFVLV